MQQPIIHDIKGAMVGLYPMKEVEAVTVLVRFNAGSWYEDYNWGAHHLLEHVMLDGCELFPTEELIELFKEENGLSTNGGTGGRILEFVVRAPSIKIREGLSLLCDSIFHPLLKESDIARNKTIIAQEYRDKWSSPQSRFSRAAEQNLFGQTHQYMRDGMGEIEFINQITRKDLQQIHKKYCGASNATIVAVGNFETREIIDLLTKEIDRTFVGEPQSVQIPHTRVNMDKLYWSEDVMKVSIGVDWMSSELNEDISMKHKITTNLGRYILGGSQRSRLLKELRMKRGWVYHASSGRSLYPTQSGLWVSTSTDLEKASSVYELLLLIPQELVKNGIPKDEYDRARSFLNMQTLIGFDSVGAIANKLMSDLFFDKKIHMPEEVVSIANTITSEEVVDLLSVYLKEKPIVSVMAKTDPKLL